MLLCTDVGNTNIKFALFSNDKQLVKLRFATDSQKTSDEYAVELYSIFNLNNIDIAKINGSIISSVVPKVTTPLTEAIKKVAGVDTVVLGPGVKTGLDIKIDNPSTLGSDIVAMSVAVKEHYPCPAIVVSLGTATVMGYINKNKTYCGGIICPGVSISLDALTSKGALLPSINLSCPEKVINTNTVNCIRSGMIYGTASMLDGMFDRFNAEAQEAETIIATGGNGPMIIPECKHKILYDDDLILKGLQIIYNKNK